MLQLADLSPHLQSLLFQQGEVALADIGCWKVVKQPAVLQRVAGTVLPKRGELSFEVSENQATSPELLQRLQEAWQTNEASTAAQLKQQLETLHRALAKRQRVLLPGMGWLSSREEGIAFESSNNNFLLTSFGLGPVDAYPVIPKQKKKTAATTTAAAAPKSSPHLWWLGLIAILLLLPVIWFIWRTPSEINENSTEAPLAEPAPAYQSGGLQTPTQSTYIEPNKPKTPRQESSPPSTAQTTPAASEVEAATTEKVTETPPAEPEEAGSEVPTGPPAANIEVSTDISPEEADYYIILGSFVDAKNVSDYREKVKQAGYGTLTQEVDAAVRVGIPVKGEEAAAKKLLQEVQAALNKDAWLKKR